MKKFVIERNIPGAGGFTPEKLREISGVSCDVLIKMGAGIQWQHSYVAGDKIYCVYIAESEQRVREHAQKSGFPADLITPVTAVIDPVTAYEPVRVEAVPVA